MSLTRARALVAAGDDEGALAVVRALDHGLESRALEAEILERLGKTAEARLAYEHVIAEDIGHGRALARAKSLRAPGARHPGAQLGTLLGEGSVARGRYRLLAELGRGGAGTVFRAVDGHTTREVALKIYHHRKGSDLERLRVEASMAVAAKGARAVRIYDVDLELAAIAMAHAPKGSLKRALLRGELEGQRPAHWILRAAEALLGLHARDIVHRDLKPSNLLIAEDGGVWLTDLGLALRVGASPRGIGEGSLGYMPPEQGAGAAAHPSADLHALGRTLEEVLDLEAPETRGALQALARAAQDPDPHARPDIERFRSALSALL